MRDESYLHFGGMCSIAGIDADSAARDTIDGLLTGGFLHRGLLVILPRMHACCFHPDRGRGDNDSVPALPSPQ